MVAKRFILFCDLKQKKKKKKEKQKKKKKKENANFTKVDRVGSLNEGFQQVPLVQNN